MEFKTYSQMKDKVLNDLGLEQEQFISESELMGYFNEAIDDCESEILTIYEDYFLSDSSISLVDGQFQYGLPANIYANKVRGLIYSGADQVYPIRRFKRTKDMFAEIEVSKNTTEPEFRYFLSNASGVKLNLIPVPRKSETDVIKMYYIRNANRMEDDTSICDIPEFSSYVIQFVKVRCYEKEGHPNLAASVQMLEALKKKMQDTLANMTPDGDDELVGDTTHYEEMV